MSFGGAHDFNIETANMGSTNSGPLMFFNNRYDAGSTHNQAIASGGTPVTMYIGSPSPAPSRSSAPPPSRIPQRSRSDYSRNSLSRSSANPPLEEAQPRLIAPHSNGRSQSQRSDTPPPVQPPYSPAAPLDRQQSEYSSYSSPEPRSQGPPLPLSAPSNQQSSVYPSSSSHQVPQAAEAWSSSPEPRSPNAYAQPSPQVLHPGMPSLRQTPDPPQSQSVPSGSPFVAGGDSFYAEAEAQPPAVETQPSPDVVAQPSSVESQGSETQDPVTVKKKRTFWQKMTSWGHRKSERSVKRQ